ncbi:MAG: UDP-N-acetylmuramoyl-tripeptide--D-alanyl-D-alanine ligase [Dokdonella sp.]|uniref:UDP-N-acetylmuramoyl-tripeptide--D-alanyl-D- alanine ligase n=1 Tax=Dokdonella sp. TaxID=2291710 RepID=UPI0025C5AEE5|nr:UDP-N-acetylmuramoyl-tripeptide--D-alanyl-D-alanine ligase [Dokdonella sp.]MBZ0221853.1 UDP-N-acetylmuramoyl-tripeptide--D-alanyl-D-alanine ligase [Dokdonella sp.]MCC7256029.1 UDP-N-acetylmuramoyl-tripeptide--D-alanyl-D-alanine ligase [Dokdonella sp.]
MLNCTSADIARWSKGRLQGSDVPLRGVAIDSRQPMPGALFIALRGEQHDGHDFAADAVRNGAAALLVERALDLDLPQILVADSQLALGDIAHAVRRRSNARVIGITGSNGKTTVKTLLASILVRHGRTHVNAGNFNNEIGLPLTLLAMPADTEYAILEMGAGKPGDIAYLARIAQPDAALVNNVAPAHLERLGSLQGVAETKGAIYRALPADGLAVINADEAFADYFGVLARGRRLIRYGLLRSVEIGAAVDPGVAEQGRFRLLTPRSGIEIELPLRGRHNIANALAASALAFGLGVPLATIKAGLESAPPVAGRLARIAHASGAQLIDDSYNANPGSFAAAIATLAAESGERVLVMGDMAELGPDAQRLHGEVGALAKRGGINKLLAVGTLSRAAVESFGAGAQHFSSQSDLIAHLRGELHAGVIALIKGSRSSAMDKVVRELLGASGSNGGNRHAA